MSSSTTESKGTALVTGSAQGIGRAIALRLAADGFDVALNDIASKTLLLEGVKAEIIAAGGRAGVFCGDVSVDAEVRDMVAGAVEAFGGLDVMVSNAAICKAHSLLDMDVSEWDQTFATNTRGMFLCYKYAAKQMILQGRGGRIIGATSGAGKQGYGPLPDYSASKFAVRGLTQAAAQEFGKYGITVNTYAPGSVITPMTEPFADQAGMDKDAFFAMQAKQAATGVNPTPENIASFVSFLASKESSFITGQSILADGGRLFD
ncbi:acetoin reductase family protein [Mycena epipterygia]|nr:acetoin reductase family protein [Mycena epipterygia]